MADEPMGVTQEPKTPQQILGELQQECAKELQAVLNKYSMTIEISQISVKPK